MRAIRWHARNDVRLDQVPVPPPPGPGEVRIAVAWSGICGTDREEWRHGPLFIAGNAPHPLTGREETVRMTADMLGSLLRAPLYSPVLASGLPLAIEQASAEIGRAHV